LTSDAGKSNLKTYCQKLKNLLVSFSQSSKFFLASCVPNVEFDWTMISKERDTADFDSLSGCGAKKKEIKEAGKKNLLPMYFFSNSPVKCLLTKVVLPTPPSPTMINLNSATGCANW